MDLTLLRHAAPMAKYQGCYNGHTNIAIDPKHFEYDKIASLAQRRYDRIYTSDLIRCRATLEQMQINDYILDERLREVRFKPAIEGKRFADIEQMEGYSPELLTTQESWHAFICDEPLQTFRERIQHFLEELPRDQTILICTHGGVIAMMLSVLAPQSPAASLAYLDHISLTISL